MVDGRFVEGKSRVKLRGRGGTWRGFARTGVGVELRGRKMTGGAWRCCDEAAAAAAAAA